MFVDVNIFATRDKNRHFQLVMFQGEHKHRQDYRSAVLRSLCAIIYDFLKHVLKGVVLYNFEFLTITVVFCFTHSS
jgi:hypothetical protein